MESVLRSDKDKEIPPVPIKTYQWEDLRKAREVGGYPWTHLLKPPLEGEITAEDIIRETTPRRSMSREVSRSRTHSPIDGDVQRILNLDSSPGSSRKHGEEGEDGGVQIPNFSKEVSLESEDDASTKIIPPSVTSYAVKQPDSQPNVHLIAPLEIPKNVSPKGILKRRVPEHHYIGVSETREKTRCCHPLVNKIKHLADKTLHKLEKNDNEKSPVSKRKKNEEGQEIRQLRNSPGASRRQKFSAIKLGDSDEMSRTINIDTPPPPRKKKEHIYEDIDDKKNKELGKTETFSPEREKQKEDNKSDGKENESLFENKSILSQDPSLVVDENSSLRSQEHVMEKLHSKIEKANKKAADPDDEIDSEEPNVDEIFENQLDERRKDDSPNITITEITDDDADPGVEQSNVTPIATSPTPSPCDEGKRIQFEERRWSRLSSDHEYEIIEKPPPNIIYTEPSVDEKQTIAKTDDELSSTTSLERKYLQHNSDEDEQMDEKENIHDPKNENLVNAQALQKNIEDRFFVNTPSTVSRTECEISTSQVDSSALENLPLKRESRSKNSDNIDNKIQKRIKEGTGKLKTQAGKLKTKLQNIKSKQFTLPDRPKINFPDRSKFKIPERPKISLPDRSKFTLPDRRKFSLPDRPKFKSINFSEKLSFGDRMKFERPKFNVPDLPKLRMPDRSKISFPSLGKKKEYKVENQNTDSNSDLRNVSTVEFEAKTYPRLFSRKKKNNLPKTSSSPTLNRDETPPPTFTFTRVKKTKTEKTPYIPDEPQQPREYGNIDSEVNFESEINDRKQFDGRYDFDKLAPEYMDEPEPVFSDHNRNASTSDVSPCKQEYTHVINEINNDEFFVRPRGISRENIQVREYLSDEIRQAFNIPKNSLALMGSDTAVNINMYANDVEADPELLIEDEPNRYSTEDLNERDDGYYTFPPVRPSRAKRKKKEAEQTQYLDESVNASEQFSEIDLGLPEDNADDQFQYADEDIIESIEPDTKCDFNGINDLHAIHEYANEDVIQYPEAIPLMSQTLPMPPKRKKKFGKKELRHSSLSDFNIAPTEDRWEEPQEQHDVVVYRTEHEYVLPESEMIATEQSPTAPRRTRSKSSRCTSVCDDDRTSHGAESLILDTHILPADDLNREIRHESPGYATVDKNPPNKGVRRSKSKTPPVRRRKSNSSERKYYTVGSKKTSMPDRPPRKKSSTSLLTLDSFTKKSSTSLTQYNEIEEPELEEVHKNLNSGEVLNKMKDRPLPPPPRPPRGSRRKKKDNNIESKDEENLQFESQSLQQLSSFYPQEDCSTEKVEEIEVSTQTDPLPDDVDFELGIDDNLDLSMNSLRDLVDEESISKSVNKQIEISRMSRPTSRSEKSIKLSDPKISEISKSTLGRTSPTVILVERRVSSPTRINERDEMLTEASLTVQHIDVDESQIPNVPPLPRSRDMPNSSTASKNIINSTDENALETVTDMSRDVRLDNLITQRLQVRDLDVGRLNVSELQASKILVSDIEGMTLQVNELDSKSGHISVSGIEFSQSIIDEIVKKFAEISTNNAPAQTHDSDCPRSESREEHTQTDPQTDIKDLEEESAQMSPPPKPLSVEESDPPQRPPPPDLTPLLYSYLQDLSVPPTTIYHPRSVRERSSELHDHPTAPPPPARRAKRKPTSPITESSSDDGRPRPSPRRLPPPVKLHEPTVVEAGTQFLRVCQNSISRMMRNIFHSFMSYISSNEDKRDVQMALVIFLVLIAGLIMFGLSDSRTIHHHHWEFFNPPDGKQ